MVIGNGMVASGFARYKSNNDFVIFASGVSNSKTTATASYDREMELLKTTIAQNKDKILVYFSSCSLYDPAETGSDYVLHKREIEALIQRSVSRYHIFRVSNLVGKSDNPNTVLNYFYYHMHNKINFDLWKDSTRNLIDIDDMFRIADYILRNGIYQNQVINIANPVSYDVKDIVSTLENVLHVKANFISIAKGSAFSIDTTSIFPVIQKLDIQFGESYLITLIKKYYLNK